ncbi:MAG: NAD(P)-binding domain-containing protein [Gordonia sp. (in: high G+C Gram-positive bacteria)]|uniref:NADPH-dependent F420 reductase n=1 Tax=Gordonia sp. (in: high G+C Gram-positive bacteria) TaxID=84139 RepID=UPI0039E258E7
MAQLGDQASADTVAGAVERADIVVLAVPFGVYADLPADLFAGKTVIDATNYYPARDGDVPELLDGSTTSSEVLAGRFAGADLVKGMNNVDFVRLGVLGRPAGSSDRTALPIAGDSTEAKRRVTEFLDVVGYDALDLGPLAEGRRSQPGTPIYVTPYSRTAANAPEDPMAAFLTAEPVPVPAAEAEALAALATR